jgi:hypothetical protein
MILFSIKANKFRAPGRYWCQTSEDTICASHFYHVCWIGLPRAVVLPSHDALRAIVCIVSNKE